MEIIRTAASHGFELDLERFDDLDPILRKLGNGLSEYSFSNLYLFRRTHAYRFVSGRFQFIAGTTYDGERHRMPLFELSEAPVGELREAIKNYDCFYPISEESLLKLDDKVFCHSSNRDDSDYLYPANHFIHYRGASLRKKRNLLHQYYRVGDTQVLPIQEDTVANAIDVLNAWQAEKGKPPGETDYDACLEALKNHDRLGMEGYVHYRSDLVAGFIVGRDLGKGICAIQFAKGLKTCNGVYQAMFQDYAVRNDGRYRHYNFEQDLGNVNFRKTKLSYGPERLLKKHRVFVRPASAGK